MEISVKILEGDLVDSLSHSRITSQSPRNGLGFSDGTKSDGILVTLPSNNGLTALVRKSPASGLCIFSQATGPNPNFLDSSKRKVG